MPMTKEEKEKAKKIRQAIYREQKDQLDKMKLEQKLAKKKEKESSLWSLITTADALEK